MNNTNTPRLLQAANVAAFAGVLVVNTLASTVGINGMLTGSVSDGIPNLFVPAGLTFSIWGLIYVLLLLFNVRQFTKNAGPAVGRVGWLFVLSSAANIGWLLLWHYKYTVLSLAAMLALLASLIAIYVRLGIGREPRPSTAERWFAHVPFSVYLGWITVATIANASAALVTLGWDGFGVAPEVWTIVVMAAAVLITGAALLTRRDASYALVVLWAFAGIALKRSADSSPASRVVEIAAIVCGAVVAAGILALAVRTVLRRRA
jgi:benzodiazapine receptor